jgi:hypothetical protein
MGDNMHSAPPQATEGSFLDLNAGQIDPNLKKLIKEVVLKTRTFIVYLDDEFNVQWVTDMAEDEYASDFGAVTSRECYLEEIGKGEQLLLPNQRCSFQRLLAQSIARVLDDGNSDNAKEILNKAESFLKARTTERARKWFISATAISTGVALTGILLLWIFRNGAISRIGMTAFEMAIATGTGALGALISVVLRLGKLNVDAFAGKEVHYFEGVMRVIGGMAGALLIGLAIKSGLILGTINSSENSLTLLLAVSIVAGASERIVPNLIKQVEGTMFKSEPDPKS